MRIVSAKEQIRRSEERAVKAEAEATRLKAMVDYNVMMGYIDDPAEEDEEDD